MSKTPHRQIIGRIILKNSNRFKLRLCKLWNVPLKSHKVNHMNVMMKKKMYVKGLKLKIKLLVMGKFIYPELSK